MTAEPSVLEARNIRKSFGSLEILRDISLTARKQDVISIIGASGSGKSTFLRCINCLEIPDGGSITIEGEEIEFRRRANKTAGTNLKQLNRLRAQMGMVFQNFNLWSHMNIVDNITLAPRKVLGLSREQAAERAEYLLNKVGLYDRRHNYPSQLSGGQQQRCAIARALAMEPKLILFDEPTSALDPQLVGEVLGVMRNLAAEGRTMILVTHEMAFAREVSTQVLYLHQGRIEEQGTPQDVFNNTKTAHCRNFLSHVTH